MKASYFVVLAVLLTSIPARAECRFSTAGVGRTVTYRFVPEVTGSDLVLHVALEFQVGPKGVEEIVLPLQWAGETLHSVTNLRVISDGIVLADSSEGVKQLRGDAGRPVILAYDLKKDWDGPLTGPKQFHPVLMPEYFEFNGDNALVLPVFDGGQAVTANFDWQKLPSSWAVATSFGTDSSGAQRCQTHKGLWIEVVRALFAAGDFRVHHFQIGRRPAVLAVRGQWTFTDQEAIDSIRKVVGVVRDFWRDDNFPYFLVTLKPYDQDHGSIEGSAFTNAFWLYGSRLDSLSSMLTILSHETFHLWNPLRMGSLSNEAARATGWFTEGFTRYYGPLLVYNAGLLSPTDYVDSLNQDLRRFPTSNDPNLRGRDIALWLDGAIRRESRGRSSLNNVMFDMVRGRNQPITIERVFHTIDRYLSADTRAEFRRVVQGNGDLIAPDPAPSLSSCSRLSRENVPMFDLGFDLDGSRSANTVKGVELDGPAFAAGLRNGQPLTGVSVYNGQTDRLATITIRGDAGDRKIAYLPQGKTVMVWQYHLVPGQPCR
jgi:predicted metalloprotease with PDZ domain